MTGVHQAYSHCPSSSVHSLCFFPPPTLTLGFAKSRLNHNKKKKHPGQQDSRRIGPEFRRLLPMPVPVCMCSSSSVYKYSPFSSLLLRMYPFCSPTILASSVLVLEVYIPQYLQTPRRQRLFSEPPRRGFLSAWRLGILGGSWQETTESNAFYGTVHWETEAISPSTLLFSATAFGDAVTWNSLPRQAP